MGIGGVRMEKFLIGWLCGVGTVFIIPIVVKFLEE
jgi:hypothetical protein